MQVTPPPRQMAMKLVQEQEKKTYGRYGRVIRYDTATLFFGGGGMS